MENPWSRESFDLDGQRAIVRQGDYREVNGLLIDAGWTPKEAHSFIMHMAHARAMSEKMEGVEEFLESAQKRAQEGLQRAIESHRRAEDMAIRNNVPVASRSINLANVAICLAVIVLGLWLTS